MTSTTTTAADAAPATLADPEHTVRRDRHIQYEWEISRDDEGKRRLAVLSILHHKGGARRPGYFAASLRNEDEETRPTLGPVRSFLVLSGLSVCREEVPRFSQKQMDRFAQTALARLGGLYRQHDERVAPYFREAT